MRFINRMCGEVRISIDNHIKSTGAYPTKAHSVKDRKSYRQACPDNTQEHTDMQTKKKSGKSQTQSLYVAQNN